MNLVALYDRVVASVNKERIIDVIYLDCARPLTLSYTTLLSLLEKYGFEGWTIW